MTPAGSGDFTIAADTCTGTSLGPRTSCTVTVRFALASAGTVTATLTAANSKHTVLATDPLTGTGAVPAHLYWADPEEGTIHVANLDGTGVTTLESGLDDPFGVAVGPQSYRLTAKGTEMAWLELARISIGRPRSPAGLVPRSVG